MYSIYEMTSHFSAQLTNYIATNNFKKRIQPWKLTEEIDRIE